MNTIQENILSKFSKSEIITPEDAEYDTARALYNGMIDKEAALYLAL